MEIQPIKIENDSLYILDQTELPRAEVYAQLKNAEDVWEAIYKLKVRGAPLIGVCAAYGLYFSTKDWSGEDGNDDFYNYVVKTAEYLKSSRPTAVNLEWALKRIVDKIDRVSNEGKNQLEPKEIKKIILDEAKSIHKEDIEANYEMGKYGLSLLKKGMGILTHCNAGALATSKYGTCLSPIYLGQEEGYDFKVFSDETRPLLQGARLTCWELNKAGVNTTLICDNMAQTVMRKGLIDAVLVGCDRMASNGDGANKIGTAQVAIMAKTFGIPFYMFVPTSTIDMDTMTGDDIVIEERLGEEIKTMWYEKPMAPEGVKTFNPSFDVTPNEYITAVITEKGIVRPPYKQNLKKLLEK